MKLWTEEENACFGDEHVAEFSKKLREKEQLGYATVNLKPGLIKSGVPKERCVSFYDAAAKFYKANIWTTFKSKEIFTITWPNKGTRLFFLAAEAPEAAGNMLGMELNVEELAHLFKDGERKSLKGENDYHRALIFSNEFKVPLADLDDAERYGWALPGPTTSNGCPFPFLFKDDMDETLTRPSQYELEWFELGLRALVCYQQDYVNLGSPAAPAPEREYKIDLPSADHVAITLRYWGYEFAQLSAAWPALEEKGKPKSSEVKPVVVNPSSDQLACVMCGTAENVVSGPVLKRCGNCKLKMYCSRDCQAKHWQWHKTACVPKK